MNFPLARCRSLLLAASIFLLANGTVPTTAAEIPSPEKQLERFQLPPGFEIQLVASDPDIGQPMNLNFDVRGRLWVTSSFEYPYPTNGEGVQDRPDRFGKPGDHPPRDRLSVIEGVGADGKAAKITHFAKGLNIPIGVTPIGDGSAAVAYSIPAIDRFTDKDGDVKSDERKQLYARFGNVDTHGMSNSFTRWIDGWIYGCHGFSNESEITDAAGRVTKLRSGNTYRFKEDGSHFEQFTFGQVNPFGLTFDPLGNLYSADCHSKPLTLLLRGARYPHFGDKPDGLGFGPTMIRHTHNSTGICGPAYYAAEHFPVEFHDNLFVCNPVTGRINRDKLKAHGSTCACVEQPDFVSYDGDLFRPVDCLVGPDGALYIADFCNPIIGHYEAPLDHPERDRTHGRIWRIIYRGEKGEDPPPKMMPDLTKLTAGALIDLLADPNLQVRTLVTNYLVDAHADAAPALARKALLTSKSAHVRAHCLWILERLGALDDVTLDKFAEDEDLLVRVHATRILAERVTWSELNAHSALLNLSDGDAFVRRAAADALGQHPNADHVNDLLVKWEQTPADDTHLIHTIRLALRSHLRDPQVVAELMRRELPKGGTQRLVEIAAAADSPVATPILLAHAEPGSVSREVIRQAALQIAREGSPRQLQKVVAMIPKWFADDEVQQFAILVAVIDGLQQKGVNVREQKEVAALFQQLAPSLMQSLLSPSTPWTNHAVSNLPESESPWGVRHRDSTDGNADAMFWDSIANGEQLTGILRSVPFTLPKSFSFWMCGHNGLPNTNGPAVNHVRLKLVKTGEVLAKEVPPRHDVAREFTWNFEKHVGEQVVVEIVDAHQAGAYAWIGVGRFDPALVSVPSPQNVDAEIQLVVMIGQFQLREFAPKLLALAQDQQRWESIRMTALRSHGQLTAATEKTSALIAVLNNVDESTNVRAFAAAMLNWAKEDEARVALREALSRSPAKFQLRIAMELSQSDTGRAALLDSIAAGKASPRLLQQPRIAEQFDEEAGEADKRRVAELVKDLPPVNEQISQLIATHQSSFATADASPERGREVFKKQCAACHRIGEEGGLIGPQLDGIGNRGLQRVLEDLLDPNRNVDVAFRTAIIETTSGRVYSGIERRREGETVVIADQEGKELRIALADIAGQRRTNLSLMPSNFGETLKPRELQDLLAWLLSQRASE